MLKPRRAIKCFMWFSKELWLKLIGGLGGYIVRFSLSKFSAADFRLPHFYRFVSLGYLIRPVWLRVSSLSVFCYSINPHQMEQIGSFFMRFLL